MTLQAVCDFPGAIAPKTGAAAPGFTGSPRAAPAAGFLAVRAKPRPLTGMEGFALIEALVALLLFSLGILGLIGLEARAIGVSGDAEDRNRAAIIADRCASAMQLQANTVTLAQANTLTGLCNSTAWKALVGNPANGGLPNGRIAIGAPILPPANLTAPIVPVSVDITVNWEPPSRAGVSGTFNAATQDQFTTRVTLLLQNS